MKVNQKMDRTCVKSACNRSPRRAIETERCEKSIAYALGTRMPTWAASTTHHMPATFVIVKNARDSYIRFNRDSGVKP